MEFKHGQCTILHGDSSQLRSLMHYFAAALHKQGERVLIIDTINSLDLHNSFFHDHQEDYFANIYCVRTPMPYDLWARLNTSSGFIKKKHITAVLVTSLSLLFKDSPKREIEPMIVNILKKLDDITKEHQLITVIGSSASDNESAMTALTIITKKRNVQEVIA